MSKVIFLDVDGVLNSYNTKTKVPYWGYVGVDRKHIKILKSIIDATGAVIILSSTWKDGWMPKYKDCKGWVKYLRRNLDEYGLIISGITPLEKRWTERGKSIYSWIEVFQPEQFVLIDDEYFPDFAEYGLGSHLVHTSGLVGLTENDADDAISILNGSLVQGTEKEIMRRHFSEERLDLQEHFGKG